MLAFFYVVLIISVCLFLWSIFVCVCTCTRVALHAASLSGHVSTVRLLLEKGAMVDSLDVMKHTPLFRACEMGQRDVILTLIKGKPAS